MTAAEDSLNKIVLNPLLIENLYRKSIVEMDDGRKKNAAPLKFLGNNTKKIAVLVSNDDYTFLPEEQLNLLNRMLSACKLNTGDVAIVNMARSAATIAIFEQLNPQRIIAFGKTIPEEIPLFSIGEINNVPVLQAPGLDELLAESEETKQLKTKLWNSLQILFNIQK